jgi:hypothetical protein
MTQKKRNRKRLSQRVENITSTPQEPKAQSRIRASLSDQVDTEILSHFDAFFKDLPEACELKPFSIATAEEAHKALEMISATKIKLEKKLAASRALQQWARTRRDEE